MKPSIFKVITFVIPFLFVNDIYGQQSKMELTHFELSDIPDTFYGCSCVFSVSKEEYQYGHFLYFDDLGDNCLISVNDSIIFLEGDGEKYRNDDYTVYLQNKTEVNELSSFLTAELIILDKQGNKRSCMVYGLCGC